MDAKFSFGSANSVEEFIKINHSIGSLWPISGFGYRGSEESTMCLVYRGHADKDWLLQPSVFRDNNLKKEHDLICCSVDKVKNQFPEIDPLDDFNLLAIMQHYGIPTRLLDFTINPLVALYFACENHDDKDGQVIILKANDMEINSPEIKITSAFATLDCNILGFTDKMRDKINRNYSDKKIIDILSKNYLVYPQISNPRLRLQKGAFVAFGNKFDQNSVKGTSLLQDPLVGNTPPIRGYWGCIDILKEAKRNIIDELASVGITKDTVYPDDREWLKYEEDKQ